MINYKLIEEKGFELFWVSENDITFYQSDGFSMNKPYHIIYDRKIDKYFFRGLGHTIKSFDTLEELDDLVAKFIK